MVMRLPLARAWFQLGWECISGRVRGVSIWFGSGDIGMIFLRECGCHIKKTRLEVWASFPNTNYQIAVTPLFFAALQM
jgi:hypothetical protein